MQKPHNPKIKEKYDEKVCDFLRRSRLFAPTCKIRAKNFKKIAVLLEIRAQIV